MRNDPCDVVRPDPIAERIRLSGAGRFDNMGDVLEQRLQGEHLSQSLPNVPAQPLEPEPERGLTAEQRNLIQQL